MNDNRLWIDSMGCHLNFFAAQHTVQRLARERFLGRDTRRAGNFCRWEAFDELFADKDFERRLAGECSDALDGVSLGHDVVTKYVTVPFPHPVGWSCTDDINKYNEHRRSLESFFVNDHVTGTRVKPSCRFLNAPKTNLVTLAIGFRKARNGINATVFTLYPGPSIGRLRPDPRDGERDISKRENVVFFDPSHEGERLAPTV